MLPWESVATPGVMPAPKVCCVPRILHAGGFVEGPDSSAIDILGSGPRTRARVIKAARKAPGERGEVHVNTGVVQHIDHVFPGAGQARISAIIADQIMTGDHVPELDAGILDEGL